MFQPAITPGALPKHEDPLSAPERHLLLQEIAQITVMLGRDLHSPIDAHPASPRVDRPISPLEQLHLIAACWPRIETALACLTGSPHDEARPTTTAIPLSQARGGPDNLHALARSPNLAAVWTGLAENEIESRDRVQELRAKPRSDTQENHFVARVLTEVVHRCAVFAALAAYSAEPEAEGRARRIAEQATHWLRRPPFNACRCDRESAVGGVGGGPTSAPPYRAIRAAWRTTLSRLDLDWTQSPLLRLPAAEPWHLYEIWCYLQVAAALQRTGRRMVGGNLIQLTPHGLRLTLPTGQASHLSFARTDVKEEAPLTLAYRPYYRSADQAAGRTDAPPQSGYVSRTHTMQPDIGLEHRGRLLLLDAKYRRYDPEPVANAAPMAHTSPGLLADIDKMHAYRDAIRYGTRPAVTGAWCLFPGDRLAPPHLVAYPASSASRPFGTAQIGALRLRPGADNRALDGLLQEWLGEQTVDS